MKPDETLLTQEEAAKVFEVPLGAEHFKGDTQDAWWALTKKVLEAQAEKTARMMLEYYESRAQRFLLTDEEIERCVRFMSQPHGHIAVLRQVEAHRQVARTQLAKCKGEKYD